MSTLEDEVEETTGGGLSCSLRSLFILTAVVAAVLTSYVRDLRSDVSYLKDLCSTDVRVTSLLVRETRGISKRRLEWFRKKYLVVLVIAHRKRLPFSERRLLFDRFDQEPESFPTIEEMEKEAAAAMAQRRPRQIAPRPPVHRMNFDTKFEVTDDDTVWFPETGLTK